MSQLWAFTPTPQYMLLPWSNQAKTYMPKQTTGWQQDEACQACDRLHAWP